MSYKTQMPWSLVRYFGCRSMMSENLSGDPVARNNHVPLWLRLYGQLTLIPTIPTAWQDSDITRT